MRYLIPASFAFLYICGIGLSYHAYRIANKYGGDSMNWTNFCAIAFWPTLGIKCVIMYPYYIWVNWNAPPEPVEMPAYVEAAMRDAFMRAIMQEVHKPDTDEDDNEETNPKLRPN